MGLVLLAGWLMYWLRQGPDQPLPRLLPAPSFELTDSSGELRSLAALRNRVWLVDFIFTRCAGPCPLMTQRMQAIQQEVRRLDPPLPPDSVRFVSISVDPGYDTPEVLSQYAVERGLDLSDWWLLTGPREPTSDLIRDGFKVAVGAPPQRASALIHSTLFMLFDGEGWARAIFRLEDADLVAHATGMIEGLVRAPDRAQ